MHNRLDVDSSAMQMPPTARTDGSQSLWLALLALLFGLAFQAAQLHSLSSRLPGPFARGRVGEATCTSEQAGSVMFDVDSVAFFGCDGTGWSKLAYCCAPDAPARPQLTVSEDALSSCRTGSQLRLSWRMPRTNGSPVSEYSVLATNATSGLGPSRPSRALVGAARVAGPPAWEIWRGAATSCCLGGLDARRGLRFSLIAHAVGGSSERSEVVELQPAPVPVELAVEDDSSCTFTPADRLLLRFDRPTNRAGQPPNATFNASELLSFVPSIGHVVGTWRDHSLLELRADGAGGSGSEAGSGGASAPDDPYREQLRVEIDAAGELRVGVPELSLASSGSSPDVRLHGCFLEGFEASSLQQTRGSTWFIESTDASAYAVALDAQHAHTGKRALRLAGGRGVYFDGLKASLPPGSRPTRLSFWVRAATAANVGYLALGGSSTQPSLLFFHLKPDGSAGLLSATGAWRSGPYRPLTWLHVEIAISWGYRTIDMWLDDVLTASGVPFVWDESSRVEMLHLFNFDAGTVWWDDFVMRLV